MKHFSRQVKLYRGMRAIRAKCFECCIYQQEEVRFCAVKACRLWPLRMGRGPTKAVIAEHLAALKALYAADKKNRKDGFSRIDG